MKNVPLVPAKLGLAIVKNAVTVHGGTVAALPTPSGGLTVRFTLQE